MREVLRLTRGASESVPVVVVQRVPPVREIIAIPPLPEQLRLKEVDREVMVTITVDREIHRYQVPVAVEEVVTKIATVVQAMMVRLFSTILKHQRKYPCLPPAASAQHCGLTGWMTT